MLHPLQTAAVDYLSQRTEQLMGLFYLLTLYSFIRGTEAAPKLWHPLAVVACLLGMASKEVMVTAPLMVLLYDRTFIAGGFRAAWQQRGWLYVALASTWLLLAGLMLTSHLVDRGVGFSLGVRWTDYALTEMRVVVDYVRLCFWPHPLVFDYGQTIAHGPEIVLPYAVGLGVLLAGVGWALWQKPMLGFVGCWFFLIIAPSSSVIPVSEQPMAESRLYLSVLAIVALVVVGLYAKLGRSGLPCAAGLAVLLGWLTWQRNIDYRSAEMMWRDTLAKRPENARAHSNLGLLLVEADRQAQAIACFEEALRLKPDAAQTHFALANTLLARGETTSAIAHFESAVRLHPEYNKAHNNLGNALLATGRTTDAIAHFETALRLQPRYADAHYNLGGALQQVNRIADAIAHYEAALGVDANFTAARRNLGLALQRVGRNDEALRQFQTILTHEPTNATVLNDLGALFLHAGKPAVAIESLERAVRAKPDYAEARYNFSLALLQVGRTSEAIEQCEVAVQLKDDFVAAHVTLGNLMFQLGKLSEATSRYESALRISPANVEAHNNLGVVLMQTGRLSEAITHFTEAIRLEPNYADARSNLADAEKLLRR